MTPNGITNSKTPNKKTLLEPLQVRLQKNVCLVHGFPKVGSCCLESIIPKKFRTTVFQLKKHSNLNETSKNYIQNCYSKGSLIKTHSYLKKVITKRRLCRCWISTSKRRLRIISEQCNDGIMCYTRRHDQKERLIIKRQPENQWFENRALRNTC